MTEAQIHLKKERVRLHKVIRVNGWKSEEGRKAALDESNLYTQFLKDNSSEELLEVTVGKSKSFKLQNSKGNGYGNL